MESKLSRVSEEMIRNYEPGLDYEVEFEGEVTRDHKIDEAKEVLQELFEKEKRRVFYMRQLEVRYERRFFHWITARAINELLEERTLRYERVPLRGPTEVKFIFNRTHRYYMRQITEAIKVIREYSDPGIATACGRQAEVLFLNALAIKGFVPRDENTNEYRGRKWNQTNHNLDFILERDGISYGCEVKNTFDYIPHRELDVKLEICDFLGIKPVFIMRGSPKSYNYDVIGQGGFVLIFEMQVYPFGSRELVNRIREVLDMPVDCPRAIPEGIIERFVRWHERG